VVSGATGDGVTFRYAGAGNSVNLAGEFNSWSTSADAMTKGADGVWTITKKLSPGRYAYKFVVDGSNWKEDPAAKETVDDGFGGKNAIMVVAGGASGSGGASPAAAAVLPVTGVAKAPQFGTNGVTFTYAGPGSAVALCGSFNDWAITTDPMKQQSDGTWAITKKLAPGTYTYKFLIDGKTWKTDAANKATQEDDFGGQNSVLIVK
jgi:1,4-alpha-glucan branching enzyme